MYVDDAYEMGKSNNEHINEEFWFPKDGNLQLFFKARNRESTCWWNISEKYLSEFSRTNLLLIPCLRLKAQDNSSYCLFEVLLYKRLCWLAPSPVWEKHCRGAKGRKLQYRRWRTSLCSVLSWCVVQVRSLLNHCQDLFLEELPKK